jgi:AcrR family transcriptional regulator
MPAHSKPDPPAQPPLRKDAARNRERIIAAAQLVFCERGLSVSIEDIADRAGVGVATLYRRFPTRPDLIAAAFEAKMGAYADAVTSALADPDPWNGFCRYIERICAMQAEDQGFTDVLTLTFPTATQFEAARDRGYRGAVKLIRNAKATGHLRQDFTAEDVVMILMANAGVVAATGDTAPQTWRRLVALLLQACAAENCRPLPPAPSGPQMYRALQRLGPTTTTTDD